LPINRNARKKVIPLREVSVVESDGAPDQSAVWDNISPINPDEPHPFPVVSTLPRLPAMIPDEILDYYGWVFCQGGFLNLQMTFEQFLAVVAAVSPAGLSPEYDASEASYPND